METFALGLTIGLVIGTCFGMLVMALCASAGHRD